MTCVYIGFSTHNVPSWSNVAIRSSCGTNCALPGVVVACTKLTIACLAGPSFHDGNGSPEPAAELDPWALALRLPNTVTAAAEATASARNVRREIFMLNSFCYPGRTK